MDHLQHFSHHQHPLVFEENERRVWPCYGCREAVYGPSYSCKECKECADMGEYNYIHHKSCAELPLGLHHPLHPKHPLILFDPSRYAENDVKEYSKCEVCKEDRHAEYRYRCSRCNFNIHIGCTVSPIHAEFHDHPLIPSGKSITFTCDICGKKDEGVPNLCGPCSLWIHRRCARYPRRVKVVRHKHPLHLTHSSHEVHQSDSRFCQICVQKLDTDYGLYYCSECDFVAHLDCATDQRNREELKDEKSTEQSVQTSAFEVKKHNVGKDGTKIATEIKHFSHEHDLKLSDEVQNNKLCNGCVRAIHPPFYSCGKCSFFLHKSCVELPRRKRHPLHQHSLTLRTETLELCNGCCQYYNGFSYSCGRCNFDLDVQCSLISDILTHEGHEHRLMLSNTPYRQTCNGCDSERYNVFRCTICGFALDFKCATLPLTARYEQHEHPFTLCYTAEDDSGEYYCDICEEERNPKHWFYYCANCSYPAHPKCILGEEPNVKKDI